MAKNFVYIDSILTQEMAPTQREYWALMSRIRPGPQRRQGHDLT